MSFTEQVKNELARIQRDDRDCRVAELLALLRMSGSFITGGHGAGDWNSPRETALLRAASSFI